MANIESRLAKLEQVARNPILIMKVKRRRAARSLMEILAKTKTDKDVKKLSDSELSSLFGYSTLEEFMEAMRPDQETLKMFQEEIRKYRERIGIHTESELKM